MRPVFVFLLLLLPLVFPRPAGARGEKPNILLILADDLGWSDLGCYGSEIKTPNLDSLAKNGLRFTQFYNSARCSPSRAAILTGLHPHQAGFPNLSGVLAENSATLPEVLKPAGYQSYMVGKWHLSQKSKPTDRGFEEFYGMLGGYNSCWQEDPFYTRWPEGRTKRSYAPGQFYSTDVFGDYALDFIGQGEKSNKPWFLYLAFNAPHFPLHAPESEIAKYEKLYVEKGWDRIRDERLVRQKQLGLVPSKLTLTPRSVVPANRYNEQTGWADKENPAWESLPQDRRRDLARRMAIFAAMVDRMDQNIGRIVAELKRTGQLDNTVIFFLSDNGGCAEWDPWGFDESSGPKNTLHTGPDLTTVGGAKSYISYGSGWANVSNTPWRLYKHYNHEGGIRTPLIVHWPRGLTTKSGALTTQPGYITDFMPTVLALTGATYPNGKLPLEGVSLAPTLQGKSLPARQIFIEHEGNRSVRDGDWKLVGLSGKPWELYNLKADPTEMQNLASKESTRVAALAGAWDAWAARCSVVEKNKPAKDTTTPLAAIPTPQIALRALTIQCELVADSRDGVVLAQGGQQNGYALHLKDGKLVFSLRSAKQLTAIQASDALPVAVNCRLEARLASDGTMLLLISGKVVATGKAPALIAAQPQDGLSIGRDDKTAVGDYTAPYPLRGTVTKVKVSTL